MIRFCITVICLIWMSMPLASAREFALSSPSRWGHGIETLGLTISSPTRWTSSEWTTAAWVGAATGVSYLVLDDPIQSGSQRARRSGSNSLASIGDALGHPLYLGLGLSGVYTLAYWNQDDRLEAAMIDSIESVVVSTVITQGIKVATRRHRPLMGDGHTKWDGPGFSGGSDTRSFPSNHTAAAFSVATTLSKHYPDYPALTYGAYGLASFVGWSRINDNKHWFSDVLFGAAIGVYVADLVSSRSVSEQDRIAIYPTFNADGVGLTTRIRF